MDLALDAIVITNDLHPTLDALPVEQARRFFDLVGEKVERLRRNGVAGGLAGERPGDVCATVELILWVFQGITCHIALFARQTQEYSIFECCAWGSTFPRMYEIADRLVGKVLRKLRIESGLRQEQVAERLDSSQSMISKFESGDRSLHLGEVYAYAEALGVSPQRILQEVWDSQKPPHGKSGKRPPRRAQSHE